MADTEKSFEGVVPVLAIMADALKQEPVEMVIMLRSKAGTYKMHSTHSVSKTDDLITSCLETFGFADD